MVKVLFLWQQRSLITYLELSVVGASEVANCLVNSIYLVWKDNVLCLVFISMWHVITTLLVWSVVCAWKISDIFERFSIVIDRFVLASSKFYPHHCLDHHLVYIITIYLGSQIVVEKFKWDSKFFRKSGYRSKIVLWKASDSLVTKHSTTCCLTKLLELSQDSEGEC